MARARKLTAVEIMRAKGPAVLHDGGGLYLRVTSSGAKSWVFRFQIDGRRRDMGLGSYPALSLAEARSLAVAHRQQHQAGIDPLDARRTARQAQRIVAARGRSFREVAEEFIERNRPAWRSARHADEWKNTLETYAHPKLGELAVAEIDLGLVVQVLEPIWATKPETASRLRGRIEMVLDAAIVRGFRDGPNPAQWKGNLAHIFPARSKLQKVEHHAALPFDQAPAFLATLRTRAGMGARAFEFAVLTAARTGEVLGGRWREIDLAAKVWTIPAERMKAGREHRVPLSDAVLELLNKVAPLALTKDGSPDPAAPVFPGPRRALPLSNVAMWRALRRMKRADLTVHGLRSTFADWAAERTAFPREVVEMALAHVIENKVEAAYRRGDLFEKRRKLMKAWAEFCEAPRAGEVVSLRAGA